MNKFREFALARARKRAIVLVLLLVMLEILLQFEGSCLRERSLSSRRGCFRAHIVPFDDSI